MQEETNTFSKHQKVCRSELYNSSEVDFSEEATEKKLGHFLLPNMLPRMMTFGRLWDDFGAIY